MSPYSGGPLNAPSMRPDESVMTAAPGFAAANNTTQGSMTQLLSKLALTDNTGTVAQLLSIARNYNA